MNDWKIERRHPQCAACSHAFDEGESHFSALCVRGDALVREDRCVGCWKTSSASDGLFWWRTRHSLDKRRGVQLNLEALEQLFIHLEGKSEQKLRELRYVLCLILLRKRRLKVRQIVRDHEGESFIVYRPRQAESLSVFVFDFTPERIDQLRAELQHIFDGAEPDSLPEAQLAAATPTSAMGAPAVDAEPAFSADPPQGAVEPAPR
ncbi:MAG: hypothetical protein IT453_02750 [Planctomycetes bacterium]|nr:hypothetical protein [Planctomycetota bacterium]